MAHAKHDWLYFKGIWDKLKSEQPELTLKQFTADHELPYDSCQMAFSRIEKRRKANKPTKIQPTIFDPISSEETKEVIQKLSNDRIAVLHTEILQRLYRCMKRLEEIQEAEKIVEIKTTQDVRNSVSAVSDVVRTLREILPFIIELRDRSDIEGIINRLENRECDVMQAALEIAKLGAALPDTIKIMLAKSPPVIIQQDFSGIPEDELDERAAEALRHVEHQRLQFLPERAEEIRAIKEELAGIDQFNGSNSPQET